MSYFAIVTPITNLRKHPNADRLMIGNASGYNVIIGLDTKEGELGILFPEDGQLSHEMCHHNNLYRHSDLNENSEKSGFFEDNRRVKAKKFRKANSEGFWCPVNLLSWAGDSSELKEGQLISKWNGKLICEKYFTPATLRSMKQGEDKGRKVKPLSERFKDFRENKDVNKLRLSLQRVPEGARVILGEKLHGSSGRTGNLPETYGIITYLRNLWISFLYFSDRIRVKLLRKLNKLFRVKKKVNHKTFKVKNNWWTKFVDFLEEKTSKTKYVHVSGSRRIILDPDQTVDRGFYSGKKFRINIHNMLKEIGLREGETLYYEIVGFDEDGCSIMGSHNTEKSGDKKFIKKWGKKITYTYGCNVGEYQIYVYRITITGADGTVYELPWHQVKNRCYELGLNHTPELAEFFLPGNKTPEVYTGVNPSNIPGHKEFLMEVCEKYSQGASTLDDRHIREGVCVRIEHAGMEDLILKYKSFHFCTLEGIVKNSSSYVDLEETS